MLGTDDILENLSGIQEEITNIRIYLKNIYATKRFSFGTWTSRQHLIVAVDAGEKTGYAESIITVNQPEVSLDDCILWSGLLRGHSVSEAIIKNRDMRGIFSEHYVEMLEMALVDLAGKIKNTSALSLLGLSGDTAVYGVYVILSDDLDDVAQKTAWAVAHGKDRFIKVKLFGNNQLDCDIIKLVRQHAPKSETYIIGDVNGGYHMPAEGTGCSLFEQQIGAAELHEIAAQLKNLYNAGLDACEDPAYISLDEWVELQKLSGALSLIPDYPLRPSRASIDQILPGMGRIYNIHPDSAGSIIDAIALARRIKGLGAGLMVGDDSLVGPSATIWQQLAIGLEAMWVEATEKSGESDFYYKAVKCIPTDSSVNPIHIRACTGFGIELNEEVLLTECDKMIEVKV